MSSTEPVPPNARPPERPGWMAIALIAIFVLTGIAIYLIGVRLVSR
jgi:hypothetical protein